MLLFLKGFVVGVGKMIPGVSGAMLAVNFKIYERLLNAITNFFSNKKENFFFLSKFCLGVIVAILLCSNIIFFLFNNYKFITMMFFIGLLIGGVYSFSMSVKYSSKNVMLIIFIVLICSMFTLNNFSSIYIIKNNYIDNIVFFVGGMVEIFASIIPGISGTSLLMMMGIYNEVLKIISFSYNYHYVLDHINLYISYGLGMFFSFIINAYFVNYIIKKYRNISNIIILGLGIYSAIVLMVMTFRVNFTFWQLLFGLILFFNGICISFFMGK